MDPHHHFDYLLAVGLELGKTVYARFTFILFVQSQTASMRFVVDLSQVSPLA
jgi:hypothetical protein